MKIVTSLSTAPTFVCFDSILIVAGYNLFHCESRFRGSVSCAALLSLEEELRHFQAALSDSIQAENQ